MIWICYAIMILVPYLMGGINTSIIVTKITTGKDIRTMGSHNAGLTNTLRSVGKKAALVVLIGDASKAAIGVLLVRLAFLYIGGVDTTNPLLGMSWVEVFAVFMAIVGHCFPVYYGFKGGKGVLAAISAIFLLDWRIGLILIGIFAVVVGITRYVSLGSCICSAVFFAIMFCFDFFIDHDAAFIVNTILSVFCGGLIIFRHRENIKRLVNHCEKKLGEKAK